MASSSYYYELYKKYKKLAKEYGDNIKDLQKINNTVSDDLYSKIQSVNNELDNLKEDLVKSVRHNSDFSKTTNSLPSKKEKGVSSDNNMRNVTNELSDEISELNRKKNDAEDDRDYYYRRYQEKKQEEREAFLKSLTGG